jgi:glyoxalase family protein
MEERINGFHHITALASDVQSNYDFYTKILGLRFVKKTVNFDAPDVYHLYFGDESGSPGSIITFFPFPNARRGTHGNSEAAIVSFAVPENSLVFWQDWLKSKAVGYSGPFEKFGYSYISLTDPDGLNLELTECPVENLPGWDSPGIPRMYSIRKFFGTTLWLSSAKASEELIVNVLGLSFKDEAHSVKRYVAGVGDHFAFLDISVSADRQNAIQSAGSVHHIAWRTESNDAQREWINRIQLKGYSTTDIVDRNYFKSIYFREPGGVLFEIATDAPGFLIDESKESLGTQLKLPQNYESRRSQIEQILKPINY